MKNVSLRRSVLLTIFAVAAFALGAACDSRSDAPNKPVTPPVSSPSPAASPVGSPVAGDTRKAELLVGKWTGPEGTYLEVTKKGDKFQIEIKNLNGPKTFEGTAKGDVIEFTRNGKTETVKAATGADTGMKGFEKETTCVVVTKGSEGFCKKPETK